MRLYTSYYAIASSHKKAVSIAAKAPKWYTGKEYTKLAPRYAVLKSYKEDPDKAAYTKNFNKYLSTFFIEKVLAELGNGSILLCYEKAGDFCHRHIVAKWIEKKSGIVVVELNKELILLVDGYDIYTEYPQGTEKGKIREYLKNKLETLPPKIVKGLGFKL